MPQGSIQTSNTINPSGVQVQQKADAQGAVRVATGGVSSKLNISTDTVVKATPGRVVRVSVNTAGTGGVGEVHDCAATADMDAANLIGVIPNTVGIYDFEFPCAVGITIKIGAGSQVVAVSYS